MKRVASVGVLVALTLGLSVWFGSRRADAGILNTTQRSRTRLFHHGRLRCTATVKSEVEAGQALSVKVVLHNVSKRGVRIALGASVSVKAADGTVYVAPNYDGLPGVPPPLPRTIRGGASTLVGRIVVPVRWNGPLQVTPACLGETLPALQVHVAAPGPPASAGAAVDEVVAASGHLLDHCRPQAPGFPVNGQIDPPSGSAPPMNAQCSVSLTSKGMFWVAQVLVLIPSDLPGVQIFQPYETLWPNGRLSGLTGSSLPYEAIAWEFVVTGARATPVAAASLAATSSSSQIVPSFEWNGSGWRSNGSGSCGGTGFAWGGTGPDIEFISACSA